MKATLPTLLQEVQLQQMFWAFHKMQEDTNPAYFPPVLWHNDSRGAGGDGGDGVRGCLQYNLHYSWWSEKMSSNSFCDGKFCHITLYHISVSFQYLQKKHTFVPNNDAVRKWIAYQPISVTIWDRSSVQTHYTLTHTQSHKVIVASDVGSFIIRPRHILHQLMVSDWWMRYVITGKQYDLWRWFHALLSLTPLLTALYSVLILIYWRGIKYRCDEVIFTVRKVTYPLSLALKFNI